MDIYVKIKIEAYKNIFIANETFKKIFYNQISCICTCANCNLMRLCLAGWQNKEITICCLSINIIILCISVGMFAAELSLKVFHSDRVTCDIFCGSGPSSSAVHTAT